MKPSTDTELYITTVPMRTLLSPRRAPSSRVGTCLASASRHSRSAATVAAMCGRFVSASDPSRVAAYFGAETDIESLGENYNVAPTNDIMAVVSDADGNRQ